MSDWEDHPLLIRARAASNRHSDALRELDLAEREKRLAWEEYDAYLAGNQSKPPPEPK
jgi:hypothetical protein